jgi:hypothetical protein
MSAILASIVMTGCMVGPNYHRPVVATALPGARATRIWVLERAGGRLRLWPLKRKLRRSTQR